MTITAAPRAIADAPGPRISRAAMLAAGAILASCQAHDPSPAPIYGGPPDPVSMPDAAVAEPLPPLPRDPSARLEPVAMHRRDAPGFVAPRPPEREPDASSDASSLAVPIYGAPTSRK